jgi:hypothetical protein
MMMARWIRFRGDLGRKKKRRKIKINFEKTVEAENSS